MAAASVSDNLTITSVQARKALLKAFKAKRPLFLWGPPGIGKSEVVADVTAELTPSQKSNEQGYQWKARSGFPEGKKQYRAYKNSKQINMVMIDNCHNNN